MTTAERLRDAVEADLAALGDDRAAQVRYLAEAITTVIGLQSLYAEKRREILAQMRGQFSAAQIATDLGISRARVYQILRGKVPAGN